MLVTLLLLSAALYISQVEDATPLDSPRTNDIIGVCKLGTTQAVTSALANISTGGNINILTDDLNTFKALLIHHSYEALVSLDFNLINVSSYQDGVWISWGQNGEGISGACVDFAVNSSGISSTVSSGYSVNVTTALEISGHYTTINGSFKQATLTCNVLNEGKPALARNMSIYYEDDGSLESENWVSVQSPNLTENRNGTYLISFTAQTLTPDDPLVVSVHCWDLRSIFVQANCTCVQT